MKYYRIDTLKTKDFRECSANGPGFRIIVWCQGCHIHCEGCHNKEVWGFDGGKQFTQKEINKILDELEEPMYSGITFLGGEPMAEENIDGFIDLATCVREKFGPSKTIWCYSGYTFEELIKKEKQSKLIKLSDVLVDGPFILKRRNISLRFRGSDNQRLIDIQETLKQDKIISKS